MTVPGRGSTVGRTGGWLDLGWCAFHWGSAFRWFGTLRGCSSSCLVYRVFLLFSCKPVEVIQPVVFDNSQLPQISIVAENLEINQIYESIFSDPYIGHSLKFPPLARLNNWINSNIKIIGSENSLKINIIDASIKRFEVQDKEAKTYEEKDIYQYEIYYLIEYNLYNDSNYLIANTSVESFRSTTSGRYISITEKERIIDDLVLESLRDITKESEKLITEYMKDYVI